MEIEECNRFILDLLHLYRILYPNKEFIETLMSLDIIPFGSVVYESSEELIVRILPTIRDIINAEDNEVVFNDSAIARLYRCNILVFLTSAELVKTTHDFKIEIL